MIPPVPPPAAVDSNNALPETCQHTWLSNPLDWPHIDRMILLAGLILFSPVLLSAGIGLLWLLQPEQLVPAVASAFLLMHLLYALLLGTFILMALKKRRQRDHWGLMENFIIYSFLCTTLVSGWLSGTEFTACVLLLLLGVNIALPLASIHRLKRAYALSYLAFLAFFLMAISGYFAHAPLLAVSPYQANGTPELYWLLFHGVLVTITLIILYIGLVATERWGSRESLYREMSSIDGLTLLTNRRSLIERAQTEFLRATRSPSTPLSCIMIDIDHFKRINDSHGHQAGDAVLVAVSQLLMSGARQYDEVGRYGGEEFVVLLPATQLEAAVRVAERLRSQIEAQRVPVEEQTLQVTASFGVACYPAPDIDCLNDLLKAADMALYDAKHGGRNQVVTASASVATLKTEA